jgi:hypothetical protein
MSDNLNRQRPLLADEYEGVVFLGLNAALIAAELDPANVLLLRHKDTHAAQGHSPYELWRDTPDKFQEYQSLQSVKHRSRFRRSYWASFVVDAFDQNIFAGIWIARRSHEITVPHPKPQAPGQFDPPNTLDKYETILTKRLSFLIGKLTVDWGKGKLAWVQRADKNDKPIVEIRLKEEEPFPGLLKFVQPLSRIPLLPRSWVTILSETKGVYLLTCPRTREQYVGSASGLGGFYGRWMQYAGDGHGGNVKLKSKEKSDYQVTILEVAGSSADTGDIIEIEGRWQAKLQSHLMGLNSNLAKKNKA